MGRTRWHNAAGAKKVYFDGTRWVTRTSISQVSPELYRHDPTANKSTASSIIHGFVGSTLESNVEVTAALCSSASTASSLTPPAGSVSYTERLGPGEYEESVVWTDPTTNGFLALFPTANDSVFMIDKLELWELATDIIPDATGSHSGWDSQLEAAESWNSCVETISHFHFNHSSSVSNKSATVTYTPGVSNDIVAGIEYDITFMAAVYGATTAVRGSSVTVQFVHPSTGVAVSNSIVIDVGTVVGTQTNPAWYLTPTLPQQPIARTVTLTPTVNSAKLKFTVTANTNGGRKAAFILERCGSVPTKCVPQGSAQIISSTFSTISGSWANLYETPTNSGYVGWSLESVPVTGARRDTYADTLPIAFPITLNEGATYMLKYTVIDTDIASMVDNSQINVVFPMQWDDGIVIDGGRPKLGAFCTTARRYSFDDTHRRVIFGLDRPDVTVSDAGAIPTITYKGTSPKGMNLTNEGTDSLGLTRPEVTMDALMRIGNRRFRMDAVVDENEAYVRDDIAHNGDALDVVKNERHLQGLALPAHGNRLTGTVGFDPGSVPYTYYVETTEITTTAMRVRGVDTAFSTEVRPAFPGGEYPGPAYENDIIYINGYHYVVLEIESDTSMLVDLITRYQDLASPVNPIQTSRTGLIAFNEGRKSDMTRSHDDPETYNGHVHGTHFSITWDSPAELGTESCEGGCYTNVSGTITLVNQDEVSSGETTAKGVAEADTWSSTNPNSLALLDSRYLNLYTGGEESSIEAELAVGDTVWTGREVVEVFYIGDYEVGETNPTRSIRVRSIYPMRRSPDVTLTELEGPIAKITMNSEFSPGTTSYVVSLSSSSITETAIGWHPVTDVRDTTDTHAGGGCVSVGVSFEPDIDNLSAIFKTYKMGISRRQV